MIERRLVIAWGPGVNKEGRGGKMAKRHDIFGGAGFVHCFDCSGFMGLFVQTHQIVRFYAV